ncbi:unnamed protein product [Rhizophagus irregularis]|nr:unnamed protein product [Rhizophagus irregularis]
MEGWTSESPDINKFIKDTMYDVRNSKQAYVYEFLEWVPFDRFTDIKKIGEGGFSKVYSATWIDGKLEYFRINNGNYKKEEFKPPKKVALKRLNGSQNMSDKYLNKLKIHWNLSKTYGLKLYGLSKDPETKEFIMVIEFADKGNLSDFGLSGPANEQKSDEKVYGVLPYIAPEVLNGEPYTSCAIFIVLVLALSICNGSRPEFGNGTPGFYKKLAYKCMDANPGERPTAYELDDILKFWYYSIRGEKDDKEEFGHKGKEINEAFEEADKEIPTISTSFEKNSNAVYTSRAFTFSNLLPKPVNSSIIISYINNEACDSQLIDLEVSNSI